MSSAYDIAKDLAAISEGTGDLLHIKAQISTRLKRESDWTLRQILDRDFVYTDILSELRRRTGANAPSISKSMCMTAEDLLLDRHHAKTTPAVEEIEPHTDHPLYGLF